MIFYYIECIFEIFCHIVYAFWEKNNVRSCLHISYQKRVGGFHCVWFCTLFFPLAITVFLFCNKSCCWRERKTQHKMSILFQPSRIHSSFVKGRNLVGSHEVNSRVLIDRSEARISFSSLVETFGPFERQSLTECKACKQKIHTFGGHFSQNMWKESYHILMLL